MYMYMYKSCGGLLKSRLQNVFLRIPLTFPYMYLWDYCRSYYLAASPLRKKQTNKQTHKKITAERKNKLIGSVRMSCINFPVQVVVLVTSVKQADTSPCLSESTYRQTHLHMFLNIYRVQSPVASLVQQTISQF